MKTHTKEEHRKRHVELHRALDELLADWIHEAEVLPLDKSVGELMEWSHNQTIEPSDRSGKFGDA